jgi:copper resistance protein B
MSVALAIALAAQMQGMDHAGHMPGMSMPMAKPSTKAKARPRPSVGVKARPKPSGNTRPRSKRTVSPPAVPVACSPEHAAMGHCDAPTPPASADACPPEHAAMGHCTPPVTPPPSACPPEHAAMGHCAATPAGTALPAGDAPAPAAPSPTYADRIWGEAAMAPARARLRREHGGATFSQVMLNIAEWQPRSGADGYRWDGEAWFGGDVDRLVVKSEGDGRFGTGAEGEVQALYSRAIGPYFNLQGGVRQEIGTDRRYAVAGVEGLAPYWFDVEATAFLSDRGDVLARVEGYYDQRITQRLIVQPRAEVNVSAQAVSRDRIGAGLVDAELGVRLRYEIRREFAPYVGVSWERAFGETRRLRGRGDGAVGLAVGLRAWF